MLRTCLRAVMIVGVMSCAGQSMGAPTAQEIVAKSRTAMNGLKTYQATVQTIMSGGPMAMTMNAKLKRAGGKTWARLGVVQAGGNAKPNPFTAMLQNMVVVDDGKNTWTYMPAMKQYRKGPAGGAKQFDLSSQFLGKLDAESNLKYAGTENVGGRPTFAIEATPKKPRPGQSEKVRLNFDQSTYRFVRALANQIASASGQSPARQQSVTVLIQDEKVNQPIPDSVFKFTPPAGVTEMAGGGMGMPGGPPGRR